jgi:hypothetical protein
MRKAVFAIMCLLAASTVIAYCGDDVCNVLAGETRNSCCDDCACGFGMECSDQGVCVFPDEAPQITGRVATRFYGFEGWFAALVAAMAVGVVVLYMLRK